MKLVSATPRASVRYHGASEVMRAGLWQLRKLTFASAVRPDTIVLQRHSTDKLVTRMERADSRSGSSDGRGG